MTRAEVVERIEGWLELLNGESETAPGLRFLTASPIDRLVNGQQVRSADLAALTTANDALERVEKLEAALRELDQQMADFGASELKHDPKVVAGFVRAIIRAALQPEGGE